MRNFLAILFILALSVPALAMNCESIRTDLLTLENTILESAQAPCGPDNPRGEPFCCNQEKEYSCKTRRQLELEYDGKIAQLIIAEGIQSLGMSIQNNHNSLIRIPSNKLAEIENYASKLEANLNKADLLYSALAIPSGESMWANYEGTTKSEMARYVADICIQGSFENGEFCQKINANARGENPNTALHEEYLEMLNGFFNADNRSSPTDSDRERQERFESYKSRMTIEIEGNNIFPNGLTPGGYLTDDASPFKKLKELQSDVAQYRRMRQNGEDVAEIGSRILAKAQALDPIKVNYSDDATHSQTVTTFLADSFDSALTQLDIPDLLLTFPDHNNFTNTYEMLDNDYNRFKQSLESSFSQVLKDNETLMVGDQNIATICNLKFDTECVKDLCENNRCATNSRLAELDIAKYAVQATELKEFGDQRDALEAAKNCFENEENDTVEKKKVCIARVRTNNPEILATDLGKLREEVKDLDRLIARQNSTQEFQVLNLQKQMTLDLLNSGRCGANEANSLKINRNYCAGPGGDSDIRFGAERNINESYLELATNGQEIAIKLNHDTFLDAIREQGISVNGVDRLKLEQKCAEGKVVSQSVCQYFTNRDAHAARIVEDRERLLRQREAERRYQASIVDETDVDMSGAVWSGIGSTLMQNAPRLIYAGVERMQVDAWKDNQIRQINAYDDYYMNTYKPYIEDYFNNPPDFSISNWGYNFDTNYTFQSATNFQSTNVSTNFSNQVGTQINFAPIPTVNANLPRVNGTNNGRTPSSSGFSFGF